jgi:tetratricopeptide (TPR) repeat protein
VGDEAVRLLAARDAVVHYQHALEIAQRRGSTADVAELHARRGKALARLGRWVDARQELEAGLAGFDQGPEKAEQRADVLVDLLEVCWWRLDVPAVRQHAAELAELAQQLQRPDLHTGAISWLAPTISADGDLAGSIAHAEHWFARSRELGVPPPPPVQAYMPIMHYWLGRIEDAVERCQESVHAARTASHTSATMFALPNLGMTLAANGRYAEAEEAFAEARRFGREHDIGTLLARAVAMSAGYHLDVFDYDGCGASGLVRRGPKSRWRGMSGRLHSHGQQRPLRKASGVDESSTRFWASARVPRHCRPSGEPSTRSTVCGPP